MNEPRVTFVKHLDANEVLRFFDTYIIYIDGVPQRDKVRRAVTAGFHNYTARLLGVAFEALTLEGLEKQLVAYIKQVPSYINAPRSLS